MKEQTAKSVRACPRDEIAAYIDGEISPREELGLEMHFAVCGTCSEELNSQKQLLCALDSFRPAKDEIDLPADFTKVVVAKAESNVSGLRRPRERRMAFFVCTGLFLLFVIGGETQALFGTVGTIAEKIAVAGSFLLHFVYDVTVGVTIILRSLSNQIVFGSVVSFLLIAVVFFVSFLTLSRLITRYKRA